MSFTPGPGTTYLLTSTQPIPSGTANGVLYLNGSKVVTSGSALTFDGTTFQYTGAANFATSSGNVGIGTSSPGAKLQVAWSSDQLKFTNPSAGFKQIGASYTGYVSGNDYAAIILGTDGSSGGKIQFSVTPSAGSLTTAATLDQNGNLGLGVTPSASWFASSTAMQIGSAAAPYLALFQQTTTTSDGYMAWGVRLSGDRTFAYQTTGDAVTAYRQNSGVHAWFNAPSGTAGNAISFTQAMTLDASGNLGIGVTSPGRKLHVVSNSPLRMGQASDYFDFVQSSTNLWSWISDSSVICLQMNGATGAVVISGLLNTTATDGFLYVPTCAGTPTGTPNTYTGRAPIVIDTTNNKLYFYSGGQWRDAGP